MHIFWEEVCENVELGRVFSNRECFVFSYPAGVNLYRRSTLHNVNPLGVVYVSTDMSVTSDECISLSVSSISSSTMSCSVHFLFAPIVMLCVWKEQNCVTHRRLWNYVPNLLCSLMNCYVLPDLHTVLLLKVRSISERNLGYSVHVLYSKSMHWIHML